VKVVTTLFRRAIEEFGADQCTHMAAAISYYVLFSIIPLAIFLVSIFGFVTNDADLRQRVVDGIVDAIPVEEGEGENLVADTIQGVNRVSAPLTVLGLVGMAWSASAMFGAIRRSLNIAWDVEVHRPVVQQKLIDLGMVAGLGLVLLLSVAGTGLLRTARAMSASFLGPLSEGSGFFWLAVSMVLPAIFSFLAFLAIYRLVPNAPTRVRDVWPGALLAALLFEILKNGFAFYLEHFNSYDVVYGSLGAIMVFLFWTYLTAIILLLGAELAAEYPRVLRGDYAEAAAAPAPASSEPLRRRVLRMAKGLVFQEQRPGSSRKGK
jgi:membrane protein